jgi:hypothetical protein
LFSTTNDAFVVWNQNNIEIYQVIDQDGVGGPSPAAHKLISIPLQVTDKITIENLRGKAVWSNDGNVIVFADVTGLWWLDLYRSQVPIRRISGFPEQAALPISLTGNGRYLAFSIAGTRQNWILQDLLFDEGYLNLLLSPDGRYGIMFNQTNVTNIYTSLVKIFHQTFPENGTWDLQWLTPYDRHYIKTCGLQMGSCRVQFCSTYVGNLPPVPRSYSCWTDFGDLPLNDADYDPNLGLVYAPSDGHTIYIGDQYGYKWQPHVDGNIIDVEWMLPRFYYEYKHP